MSNKNRPALVSSNAGQKSLAEREAALAAFEAELIARGSALEALKAELDLRAAALPQPKEIKFTVRSLHRAVIAKPTITDKELIDLATAAKAEFKLITIRTQRALTQSFIKLAKEAGRWTDAPAVEPASEVEPAKLAAD